MNEFGHEMKKKTPLSLVEQQLTTTNYATFRVFLLFLLMPTKNTIISCYYFLIERRRSKSFSLEIRTPNLPMNYACNVE